MHKAPYTSSQFTAILPLATHISTIVLLAYLSYVTTPKVITNAKQIKLIIPDCNRIIPYY